jgi:predicted transcriptional regulator of viral defense system
MRHLDIDYYVGWLSAASFYGATHQAAQVFQVATSAQVRDRAVGRNALRFHMRAHVRSVPTRMHTTATGHLTVSTVATTMLDVGADITIAGGISNAATVILELSEHGDFDVADVARLAPAYPAAAGRRIGWILDRFGGHPRLAGLEAAVSELTPTPSRANPALDAAGPVNERWMIYENDDEIEDES